MGVRVREKLKGSGTYWVFIDHQGKRRAKKIGKDKRTAQEVARKIQARLVLGDLSLLDKDEEKTPTFSEYAQTWIKVTVPATCKPATLSDYQIILDSHVLPEFEKIPVTEIKSSVSTWNVGAPASSCLGSPVTSSRRSPPCASKVRGLSRQLISS